jgi:hypothetical protein
MKIERSSHNVHEDDVFYVEPHGGHSTSSDRHAFRRLSWMVIVAVIASALTFGVIKYTTPTHYGLQFVLQAASGKVGLNEKQLHDIVLGEGLVVYWLGPEDGALYTLTSVNKNQNYVRYLPGGEGLNDVGANFRVVGTYEAKDAFKVTQNDAKSANGVGLISADGNAIYYNRTRLLSVYVGFKNKDDQVELFNPTAGQALADAKTPGLIRRIK